MQLRHWNRLNALSRTMRDRNTQYLIIVMQAGETVADLWAKVARWKSGEVVAGISDQYQGGEVEILPVRYVSPGEV